jgi:hypothetical protein
MKSDSPILMDNPAFAGCGRIVMRRLAVGGSLSLAIVLAGLMNGCDAYPDAPNVSSSLEEATVKGVVRVSGVLVNNGTIYFKSANIRRPEAKMQEAAIGKDGSYSVTTLVGQNHVEVSCKELHTAKNRRYIANETSVQIDSGENTVDIDIPPKPKP